MMDPEEIGPLIYLVKTRRTFCSVIQGTATGLDSVRSSAGVPQLDSVLLLCQQVHKKIKKGGWGGGKLQIH